MPKCIYKLVKMYIQNLKCIYKRYRMYIQIDKMYIQAMKDKVIMLRIDESTLGLLDRCRGAIGRSEYLRGLIRKNSVTYEPTDKGDIVPVSLKRISEIAKESVYVPTEADIAFEKRMGLPKMVNEAAEKLIIKGEYDEAFGFCTKVDSLGYEPEWQQKQDLEDEAKEIAKKLELKVNFLSKKFTTLEGKLICEWGVV